jgi:hypothetical protein
VELTQLPNTQVPSSVDSRKHDAIGTQVHEAVRQILALRQLTKTTAGMQTSRAQSAILKKLPLDVLARVAMVLARFDETPVNDAPDSADGGGSN